VKRTSGTPRRLNVASRRSRVPGPNSSHASSWIPYRTPDDACAELAATQAARAKSSTNSVFRLAGDLIGGSNLTLCILAAQPQEGARNLICGLGAEITGGPSRGSLLDGNGELRGFVFAGESERIGLVRDEALRTSCFGQLAILCAEFGDEVPYVGGLDRKFTFGGSRVPFLNRQQGIFRAAVQRGEAALSIQTSFSSPYDDHETPDGFLYAYRGTDPDHRDNRALRAAHDLTVPIAYFVATRQGWYRPIFPCFVVADDRAALRVLVQPGAWRGPVDDREPSVIDDPLERRYVIRETKVRVHQARFRGRVLPAYRDQCAICRLKELRLLDAAHILGDVEERGQPIVSNGVSLCSIHHRAFDQDLVGIDPDYTVRISRRLLDEEDGPMLELLKGFDKSPIAVPRSSALRPDRERLAERFERFLDRAH
jgi:putative restriction endonuclease